MEVLTDQQLIDQIDAFLARSGMKPTRFGREVANEPSFLGRLRGGRSVTLKTANRVAEFIRDHAAKDATAGAQDSTDNRGVDIGTRGDPGPRSGEPEPTAQDPAVAASGRAPGPVVSPSGPGDSASPLRPSLFDFGAGRG